MSFAVGSLVNARGREWVVLPESEGDVLVLRPLGGAEDEIAGVHLGLEEVKPATFDLPDPSKPGDHRSCRLLRDAIRLGLRSSAGPFRSFGRITVDPRPYQLVPLLVALKQDPIRILIADDVGIGKTIEACTIARELLDRGEATRLAVLCPPHLAEQWQRELRNKFHIDAELVLPSTVSRLEQQRSFDQSIFDIYPFLVISLDFIKSDRRRDDFLRACPELVIVDEAHTCAFGAIGRGGRHQRHQVVSGLAQDPDRHLILVTATPHSGKEEAFRSLLSLLKPEFGQLPDDLTGTANERNRRHLADHFVQRRRADIEHYLDSDTPFPDRVPMEETYSLSDEYKAFFKKVLEYARESVIDKDGTHHRQRVRWWSALALLRSLASSPAAAASTLYSRAAPADTSSVEEADEVGQRTILDLEDDESAERMDTPPGSDIGDLAPNEEQNRRRLRSMAKDAEKLKGKHDAKLEKATEIIAGLVKDGHNPIVFCRFIPTAEYVAEHLRLKLKKDVEVAAVTGTLPADDREQRVEELSKADRHVLVCTDCLSEGINLQEHFDAVVHYDLSWNPTRHEQREGRVDRYGQKKPKVHVVTYYGIDNQIDGIVLDVLIRKHEKIRDSLGVSVPVPADTNQVVEALFEGLLLREASGPVDHQMQMFEDFFKPQKEDLHKQWDAVSDREKRSRTMFAQQTIKPDEVAAELEAVRAAIGGPASIASFVTDGLQVGKAVVAGTDPIKVDLSDTPVALKDRIGQEDKFTARFEVSKEDPLKDHEILLTRTHPIVEGLAAHIVEQSLDPEGATVASRCGVIRTKHVDRRTTVVLARFRFHITERHGSNERRQLAEECLTVGFRGAPGSAEWVGSDDIETLLKAEPHGNVQTEEATNFLQKVEDEFEPIHKKLEATAKERANALLDAHRRVRSAARIKGRTYKVEPQLPVDVLGIYVYLPAGGGATK